MRVLALEPYYGGSHRGFLDGWQRHSRHEWTTLTLPAHHWKWRMRHAAVTLAGQLRESWREPGTLSARPDIVWCSDMLNLAEFRGLTGDLLGDIPHVVYFHENQWTYPTRTDDERDYHFGFTNFTSCLAADGVWFNSRYHLEEFLQGLTAFLRKMPDYVPRAELTGIADRAKVLAPGVDVPLAPVELRIERAASQPLRIVWAARWEHDKNPESFFAALEQLDQRGVAFRLSVLGQSFREIPAVFRAAHRRWEARLDHWGYLADRGAYLQALAAGDVFVSTAEHEFFGLAAVEGITAGLYPLLPRRLAYPEVLGLAEDSSMDRFFFDDDRALVQKLAAAAEQRVHRQEAWIEDIRRAQQAVGRYQWSRQADRLDAALEAVGRPGPSAGTTSR